MTEVLITGGAGYIGSNTVKTFLDKGFRVFVVDNLSTGHQSLVDKRAEFVNLDLLDTQGVDEFFLKHPSIEIVVHFSGCSQVGESMTNPQKYYDNNVYAGINLLRSMLLIGCKKIIFSSSAAVYGEPESCPISEDAAVKPISVYGKTKAMFEDLLALFNENFDLNYFALRYFNAAGASSDGLAGEIHDPETHLIPSILKSLNENRSFKIFGDDYPTKDGTCVRDYIHVSDLAEAHLLAAEYLLNGGGSEVVNLGSGSGHSVKEIVDLAGKICGHEVSFEMSPRREGDPAVLLASNQKAKNVLNWSPKLGIEEMIESAWKFEIGRVKL